MSCLKFIRCFSYLSVIPGQTGPINRLGQTKFGRTKPNGMSCEKFGLRTLVMAKTSLSGLFFPSVPSGHAFHPTSEVMINSCNAAHHDDVIKWKYFPRYWPIVLGFHRSPVNSPHKGHWRGALMFSLICTRINVWVQNGETGDLRRYRAHYDVIVVRRMHAI